MARYLVVYTELTAEGTALRAALGASLSQPLEPLIAVGGWDRLRCVSSPAVAFAPRGGGLYIQFEVGPGACDPACGRAKAAFGMLHCKLPSAAGRETGSTLDCSNVTATRSASRRNVATLTLPLGELREVIGRGRLSRSAESTTAK